MSSDSGGNSSGLGWAVAGLAGLGSLGSMLSVNSANEDAKKIARENRAWMEKMAESAHQREVEDLRKAGLNPILSATGGSGAATPSASTSAEVKTPDFSMLTGLAGQIADVQKTQAETENIKNSTDLIELDKLDKNYRNQISAIEAKFAEDSKRIGLDKAHAEMRSALIKADREKADASFALSSFGRNIHAAKEVSTAYPGQVSVSGGLNLPFFGGLNGSGSFPARLLFHGKGDYPSNVKEFFNLFDDLYYNEKYRYNNNKSVRMLNSY